MEEGSIRRLKNITPLDVYIRQRSARVKGRILTTFRETGRCTIKKLHMRIIKNVYILIATKRSL